MTIDDLKFPPMDAKAKLVSLPEPLTLPSGEIIPEKTDIYLMHDGIHAIIKWFKTIKL